MAKRIYSFPQDQQAELQEVGGKGLSLIQGASTGLPVPPGFILTVSFFTPWFEQIKTSPHWKAFLNAEPNHLQTICTALKKETQSYTFTQEQKRAIEEALQSFASETLFAVRSSSPEEDLEGSSFAGGYETILGTKRNSLETAVKKAFASCWDYRVAVYKKENGFETKDPRIAVIIQEQIASEIAGVGFSLNPVTNNFDEAVFTANWGLGETVVAGLATPDTYIVDKTNNTIIQKQLGTKTLGIYLGENGGTTKKEQKPATAFALHDEQMKELTHLIKNVEAFYDKPIDIEWAFAKDHLYLLQARPITAFVPLPTDMITKPGEKKRLYIDLTISIQGIYDPLSVAGISFFKTVMQNAGNILFLRDITKDISRAVPWVSGNRLYGNVSNMLKFADKSKIARFINIFDPLAAKTIANIDDQTYISSTNKFRLLPFGLARQMPVIGTRITKARLNPEKVHEELQKDLIQFLTRVKNVDQTATSVPDYSQTIVHMLITQVLLKTVPVFIAGKIAFSEMKKIVGKEMEKELAPLEVALPHNVTTEMGLALSELSALLPQNRSEKALIDGINNRTLPQSFLEKWEQFIKKYGHRGEKEIDVAAPRYQERPEVLIKMLSAMKQENTAKALFEEKMQKASETYEEIQKKLQNDPSKAKAFAKQYRIFKTFAGYRETHKFYLVFGTYLIRQKLLKVGKEFVEQNRLHTVEEIFDLSFADIDKALKDPSLNLHKLRKANLRYPELLKKIAHMPTLIDSRGQILRPMVGSRQKGELIGTAVSAGKVRGRIKVLHTPTEKPLHKGEILVARATDPGWTPLFVNAAGIILEIGGVLQHGALVAREYGLPCVTGVANATELWTDGTMVEIDGATGSIKTVEEK